MIFNKENTGRELIYRDKRKYLPQLASFKWNCCNTFGPKISLILVREERKKYPSTKMNYLPLRSQARAPCFFQCLGWQLEKKKLCTYGPAGSLATTHFDLCSQQFTVCERQNNDYRSSPEIKYWRAYR